MASAQEWVGSLHLPRHLTPRALSPWDVPVVLAIAAFSAFASGSRSWAGFNSPDSEFYASLALYGHEVTDRAVEPSYFWTRLGYIAPVRALTSALGPWLGFAVWRFTLIALMCFGVYWVTLRFSGRGLAVVVALLVTLNSLVLSYVGNSYVTGTVLAATVLLIAVACWGISDGVPRPWLPAALAGALVAWLAMLNPYACMLAAALWIGVRGVGLAVCKQDRWRTVRRDGIAAAIGFVIAFMAFLGIGKILFREFDWFTTYLTWNSRLNQADFASSPNVWTTDVALLVPALAIVAALVSGLITRWPRPAVIGLVLALVNVVFALGYVSLVPGPTLESSYYIAMLWPAALISLGLSAAAVMPVLGDRRAAIVSGCAVVGFGALAIRAGRSQSPFTLLDALPWLFFGLGCFALAGLLARRAITALAATSLALIAFGTAGVTAQYLQNGRGSIGWFSQYPFASAYVDFGAQQAMESKIAVQDWLLARTTPQDRVAIWTDPDRLLSSVAAMQLWGADNLVSSMPVLSRDDVNRLEAMNPTVIAMYAPDRADIDAFYASIPGWAQPSALECTRFTLPDARVANSTACITRLTWLN